MDRRFLGEREGIRERVGGAIDEFTQFTGDTPSPPSHADAVGGGWAGGIYCEGKPDGHPSVSGSHAEMQSPWTDPWSSEPLDHPSRRYGICRMAFRLGAIAVGLQSADILIRIGSLFVWIFGMVLVAANPHAQPAFLNQNLKLMMMTQDDRWGLFIGTPISWSAAIAAYLLIGRWNDAGWNRRAVLLALMNTFDVYLWASQNSEALGLPVPRIESVWVGYCVGVLQWFELMLFGSLAADVAGHLGRPEVEKKSAKSPLLRHCGSRSLGARSVDWNPNPSRSPAGLSFAGP